MRPRRSATTPVAALLALAPALVLALVAGCASGAGSRTTTAGTTTTPVAPAGQVVFRMWQGVGGPLPPGRVLGLRPEVTVYADGTAFVAPRTDENRGYPGTPIAFARGRVPADVLRALVARAEGSDLFDGLDYGDAILPDAGGTSIDFRPGHRPERTVEVYALQNAAADNGLRDDQRRHRSRLRAFAERLYRSVESNGSDARWTPGRIDVTTAPAESAVATGVEPTTWPGPPVASFLHEAGDRGHCGVLDGGAALRVWDAARSHASTAWTVGHLVIRALLPGEPGCR